MADPVNLILDPTRSERISSLIERGPEADCWPWRRAANSSGYGVVRLGSNGASFTIMAHRAAWIIATGRPIPAGMQLDHLCRNRACCNPGHLRVVSRSENVRASSKHQAGDAPVSRRGPATIRTRGSKAMAIWREYLADGAVRQCGRTFESAKEAQEWVSGMLTVNIDTHLSGG